MRPAYLWGAGAVLWLVFSGWYTNLGGPLTPAEVERYYAYFASTGADEVRLAQMRSFLESDTGDDLIMVNAILMRDPPRRVEGVGPDETSAEVLARYMAYMWPALLVRACHPVLAGNAVSDAPEVWGLENARVWSNAGMMRYRSRRDLMEIAATPEFNGPHEYKIAAIEKTIAFPIEASLQLGDPRFTLALLLFGICAALHLALGRRRGA